MPGEQDRRSAFATMMRRYPKDDNGIRMLYNLAARQIDGYLLGVEKGLKMEG